MPTADHISTTTHAKRTLGMSMAAAVMALLFAGLLVMDAFLAWQGKLAPLVAVTTGSVLSVGLLLLGWRHYASLRRALRDGQEAEARAQSQSQRDPLTGCLSRHAIAPHADALLTQARAKGEAVAYLVLDIAKFKHFNDAHGTEHGDAVLVELTRQIRTTLPADGLLARLGGDEFALVVPFASQQPQAIERIVDQITSAMRAPAMASLGAQELALAFGIARSDESNDPARLPDAAMLLHRADIAHMQAKKAGNAPVQWFYNALEAELRYRCEMELALRDAVARDELEPYYEQQVDLDSGEIRGFEMLARWHSAQFGQVPPDIFIAIAEETGLIDRLSEQLIAKALRHAATWATHLTLSVNISPVQMRDPWFAQKLLKLLVGANFASHRLEVEITESGLHQNIAMAHALVTSLRNQNIKVTLDDFGTGYSSLGQLRRLPFDRIKIDRSFVMAMGEDANSRVIVEAIALLGRGLGLPVIAEGIETPAMLDSLRGMGDFKGQGYLYGRPQDAATTHAMLAERGLLLAATAQPEAGAEELPRMRHKA
jgi:diguanylate cyclase (GGDEF)-like protein